MGIWESILQYYKARLGEVGEEGKDGTDSPWNNPNEPNSNRQRQSTSRFYSFGGPIGGVASRVLNAVSHMVPGNKENKDQYYSTLYEAVALFLEKNPLGLDDILKAYASYIDESMKNGSRQFHVGYGGIRSPESFITYGMMEYKRGGDGERYSITLNPMFKYLSKISGKAKKFAAYTLIHEMTHIYMMAVGEDSSNEGMVNAIASEILERLYPKSDIAKQLKMVYNGMKGGLPRGYTGLNLFAPYVHETRQALSTLGKKIKYYVSKAVSGMSRYVSGHGAANPYSSISLSYSGTMG